MPHHRRTFLKTTAMAATGIFLRSLDAIAEQTAPATASGKKLDLIILATNWGFEGTLDQYCAKVKQEGYDGIEIWWPGEQKAQDELFATLKKYGLKVGFLCGAQQSNFQEHYDTFKKMITAAATNTVQKPLYINCHSGRDYFSMEQNGKFIDLTTELSKQTGITICHETHRARMLYSAPAGRQYFEKHPDLRITFDVSHWCNVSESLLQDQPETVALALQRTDHLHARIGHPEGPQVSDPRAPEWEGAVKAHLAWWDRIAAAKKAEGKPLTILTEFGPPDYMPTMPYTRKPLADQWAINVHMMQLLRKRYLSVI
jgi:sugar phosphate isomerase/epimerase